MILNKKAVICMIIMRISFFETEKWEEKYLSQRLGKHQMGFSQKKLTPAIAKKFSGTECLCVFIYSQINGKILDAMPRLKLISTMSTGYNHINLEECKRRGITVCNVPTYGENTVAEHTFALLLALSRKIPQAYTQTKAGEFSADGLCGFDIKGKTLGVVGCGHIGRHVVRIARGFDMNVLVYEKTPDNELAKELGFTPVSLDELYSKSDIISFHVPLNDSTRHMFNAASLLKVKKGVVVINTARGEVIDTGALIKGLQKKIIGSAGLDVLEGECDIREEKQVVSENFKKECDLRAVLRNHVLMKFPNVLITPHSAFNSTEALERILNTTIENIESFGKGKPANTVAK